MINTIINTMITTSTMICHTSVYTMPQPVIDFHQLLHQPHLCVICSHTLHYTCGGVSNYPGNHMTASEI